MKWIPVTERLPPTKEYPFAEYLVWVEHTSGPGRLLIADARGRYSRFSDDADDLVYIDAFNFQWGGGDNDRTWPADNGFRGEGGYGFGEDGEDRVTHWMPLPEGP